MVCKKCGKVFSDTLKICPYCGVGQNHSINIDKVNRELEDLKIGQNSSSFSHDEKININKPLDIDEIIEDLEELKIKEDKEEEIFPRVELISDEILEKVIDEIHENKDLFRKDTSINYHQNKINDEITQNISDEIKPPISSNVYIEPEKNNEPLVIKDKKTNVKPIKYFSLASYNKNLLWTVSVISIIVVIGLFISYKLISNPKARFFKNINESYNEFVKIIDNINNNYEIINDKNLVEISSTAKVNKTINNITSNEIINTKYVEDRTNQKQYYEVANLNNNKSTITKIFVQNDKFYINKDNTTDSYYVTDSKYISLLNYLNKSEIETLYKQLTQILKDNVNSLKFNTISVNKNISGTNYELKESTLSIDGKDSKKLISNILNDIYNNNKILTVLESHTKYTKEEIQGILNSTISKLTEEEINFKFYLDKEGNLLMQNFEYQDFKLNITNINNIYNIDITKNDNKHSIRIINKENTLNIRYRYNLEREFAIIFKKQNDKMIINYQITEPIVEDNKEVNIIQTRKVVNIISKVNKNSDLYTNNLSISVSSNLNGENMAQNIEMTNTIKEINEFPTLKINDVNEIISMPSSIKNDLNDNFSLFIK